MTTSDLGTRKAPSCSASGAGRDGCCSVRFVALNVVIASLAGGPAMRDGRAILTLVLLSGAAALAVLSGDRVFALWRVLVILGVIVVCTLLMLEQVRVVKGLRFSTGTTTPATSSCSPSPCAGGSDGRGSDSASSR